MHRGYVYYTVSVYNIVYVTNFLPNLPFWGMPFLACTYM